MLYCVNRIPTDVNIIEGDDGDEDVENEMSDELDHNKTGLVTKNICKLVKLPCTIGTNSVKRVMVANYNLLQ